MSEINYDKLEQALARLQEKFADYQGMEMRPELMESDKDSIKESLIHRFEVCYEMLWKHTKKYLENEAGISEPPNSPKPIFRLAHQSKLIDAETLERFFEYVKTRIDTAHDYNLEKAEAALGVIEDFIADAEELYRQMKQ